MKHVFMTSVWCRIVFVSEKLFRELNWDAEVSYTWGIFNAVFLIN